MSDLVERVARALCAVQGCQATDNELARASDEARAAIAEVLDAMEQPSEGMVEVGTAAIQGTGFASQATADGWQAMLAQFKAENKL